MAKRSRRVRGFEFPNAHKIPREIFSEKMTQEKKKNRGSRGAGWNIQEALDRYQNHR